MTTETVKTMQPCTREYVSKMPEIAGYTKTVKEGECDYDTGSWAMPDIIQVRYTSPAIQITFRITAEQIYRKGKKDDHYTVTYSGTTQFKKPGSQSWYSFDRRGVEDSFYSPWEGAVDAMVEANKQIERVAEFLKKDAERIDVPTLGYRITPAKKEEYSKQLKAGKMVVFTPSGFGVGHRLTVKRPRGRYGIQMCPKELADFFSVPTLWDEHMDCD